MFSKACEYGIRAAVYVALQSLDGRRVSVNEIAEEIDSPIAFTAKILQQLSRSKVIHSVKGPTGGFELDRTEMDTVKLSMIVHAIDGDGDCLPFAILGVETRPEGVSAPATGGVSCPDDPGSAVSLDSESDRIRVLEGALFNWSSHR